MIRTVDRVVSEFEVPVMESMPCWARIVPVPFVDLWIPSGAITRSL